MSYDKNSPEARKGALGEAIVKEILESWGAVVTRPDEHGEKSLVDFLAVPDENPKFAARYVEVKVRSALPYAYGQYPCYTFPVVQIEAYKKYMDENNLPVELWLVDPEKAEILLGTLDERSPVCIERKIFIDGREFPFDQKTKLGLMRFYHCAQFGGHFKISNDDLAKLRTIDSGKSTVSKENYKKQVQLQEQKAAVADKTLSLEIEDTLTTFNGTIKVEPELNAVLRPFECLHTPNGKQLSLFLTKEGAFFHLSQLETAGVDLSCIRRRFELENYEVEFAHYLSLSDAFLNSGVSNLYDWWRNDGFPYVDKTSKEFSEAREFVLKHFGIDFLCAKIWEERPKTLTKTPKVIVLDKVAKKIGELQTPNVYAIRRHNGGKPRRCIDVKDVPDVLQEYAFNHTFQ